MTTTALLIICAVLVWFGVCAIAGMFGAVNAWWRG